MRLAMLSAFIAPWILNCQCVADELPALTEVRIESSLDHTPQPSLVWAPERADREATPLLVFLHSWSGDYTQDRSPWLGEAVDRGWIMLLPNFRGRNDHPEACGSELARQDILDAIEWSKAEYKVDVSRIYLAGVSGGGHMALLMAGRHPDQFSAVSAWVGPTDLEAWYHFHSKDGVPQNYAQMIAACCGGAPGDSEEVDRQYRERSPIHWLANVGDLRLDINTGVTDGKSGSVPITHSLRSFNVIADAHGDAGISTEEIEQLQRDERLSSPSPQDTPDDPTYGREIRLRRSTGHSRITIFDGGHEGLPQAACAWLARQSRPTDRTAAKLRRGS
jgi:pimeloyl-ACP methyl ester carboxylesterase